MSGFAEALIYIVQTLGSLYLLIVLLRFILQLVRADFYNPLSQFTVKATQPLLKPLRRIIPGFGGLDLASLALAILVQLVLMVLVILIAGANPAAVGLQLPPNVVLEVVETAPELRGGTATKRPKPARLSTGLEIMVPEYIATGEKVLVSTSTGEFGGRA